MKKILGSELRVSAIHSLYDFYLKENYVFLGESHHTYEINVILEGTLGLTVGNKLYELKKGQAFIIPPGAFHKNWVMDNKKVHIFIVSFDFNSDSISIPKEAVYSVSRNDLFYIETILREGHDWMNNKIANPMQGAGQIIKNSIESLILSFLRQSPKGATASSSTGEAFYKAVHFMNMNIKRNITMTEIATFSNTSVANLKKIFKKYTGDGAMHHFNLLKLEYSKELLLSGMPICEIAIELSYSSQNHYSQTFKKVFNITPTQYKKSLGKL